MDERMILLLEEQNALLREMNTKLDDLKRAAALNVMNGLMSNTFTDETIRFLEIAGRQVYRKKQNI